MPERNGAVFITGAAGGIGAATTRTLADRGYRVYAGVRPETPRHGDAAGVYRIEVDVTDPDSVRAAAIEVGGREGGGLRAVVNNAGVIVQGPMELVPADELRRQFAVNVFGAVEVTRAFAPLLREGHGRLVNISAPTSLLPMPYAGCISASKAALDAISDAMRVELGALGIAVVIVMPGAVDTRIFTKAGEAERTALADADPARVALYAAPMAAVGAALGRMRTSPPQTVADTIVRAIEAPRPRPRYLANSDARPALLVSRLPRRLRDRLVVTMLGLRGLDAG